MRRWLRKWLKRKFDLHDISDLRIGGHCGCCGNWVAYVIVEKVWAVTNCSTCVQKAVQDRTEAEG